MNDIKRASSAREERLYLAVVLGLALAGCGKEQSRIEPAPREQDRTDAAAHEQGGGCESLTAQFAALRARGTQACSADADCACFNGLDPAVPCGGVIDVKTARQLGELQKQFTARSCRLSHQCAAQLCNPGCVSGQCVMSKASE